MKYRADIDGLRAVAVIPVVAFHTHLPFFGGGFVGVDVFFVISGYLISSIIFDEVNAGRFSVVSFYERRIRRIFPALLAALLVTCAFAYRYLLPSELEAFAKSVLAATFSVSNFYFWEVSGYFAQASGQQPLLHTWSLSVEEQFYLLFPLTLVLLRRIFPGRLRTFVLAATALSFIASAIQAFSEPMTAFYFPHSRAWELLLGTILAIEIIPPIHRQWLNEVVTAAGLLLIIGAVTLFTVTLPFPGISALVPCVGAGLIIHGGRGGETLTTRALSSAPLVFIGVISYSLYLWHWPLLFFQNNFSLLPTGLPGPLVKSIIFLSSIALATLSWRFVEQPFRRGPLKLKKRRLFIAFGAALGVLSSIAAITLVTDGVPSRFSPAAVRVGSYITYDPSADYRKGECFTTSDVGDAPSFAVLKVDPCLRKAEGKKNYLLLGDSYAADLWWGLSRSITGANVLQATGAGCKPLLETADVHTSVSGRCTDLMHYIFFDYLARNKIDGVLLAGAWGDGDISNLGATLDWARDRGIVIVLFGPKIVYDAPLPRLMAAAIEEGKARLPDRHRTRSFEVLDERIRALARQKGVSYISYYDLLCEGAACQFSDDDGHPLAFDRGHLTRWGSEVIAGKLAALINSFGGP